MTHACMERMEQVRVHGAPCNPDVFAWCLAASSSAAPVAAAPAAASASAPSASKGGNFPPHQVREAAPFSYLERRHTALAIDSIIDVPLDTAGAGHAFVVTYHEPRQHPRVEEEGA